MHVGVEIFQLLLELVVPFEEEPKDDVYKPKRHRWLLHLCPLPKFVILSGDALFCASQSMDPPKVSTHHSSSNLSATTARDLRLKPDRQLRSHNPLCQSPIRHKTIKTNDIQVADPLRPTC
jgi:hypothetical protein